jgi:hypothetical protein
MQSLCLVGSKAHTETFATSLRDSGCKFDLVTDAVAVDGFLFVCDISDDKQWPYPLDTYYQQISRATSIQKVDSVISDNFKLRKFLGFAVVRKCTQIASDKIRNQRIEEITNVANKYSFPFFDETVAENTILSFIEDRISRLSSHPLLFE